MIEGIHDVAFIAIGFRSGVAANVELGWLTPCRLRRAASFACEEMIVDEDGTLEPVRVFDEGVVDEDPKTFGEYQLSDRTGGIRSRRVPAAESLVPDISGFARYVAILAEAAVPIEVHDYLSCLLV